MTSSSALQRALMMENYPTNTTSGGGNYTNETLTFSGGLITDAVRAAGLEGDGLTPPAGVGVWPAATNLVTNGGFETDTTGWSTTGTVSIARITTDAKFGDACLEVTTTTQNAGAQVSVSGNAGQNDTYGMSCWVKAKAAGDVGKAVQLLALSQGGTFEFFAGSVNLTADWQRIPVNFTWANASHTGVVFQVRATDAAPGSFLLDGVQYEANLVTPYIETDGGTASRVAGRVQQPDTDDLMTEAQGWVYGATRFGIANTALSTGIAVLWQWLDDADNFLRVAYDWQNNRVSFIRRAAGVQTESTVAATFAAQGLLTWGADWTATEIAAIANGARATPSADTNIPTLTATAADIGSNAGTASFLLGNDRSFETGSGTLTDADSAALHAFGDTPPTWAQIKGALPATAQLTSLWPAVTNAYQKVVP